MLATMSANNDGCSSLLIFLLICISHEPLHDDVTEVELLLLLQSPVVGVES
jgi:hypothetical protein